MGPNDFNNFQVKQFASVINLVGEPVTYQGLTFNAAVRDVQLSNEPMDGGLSLSLGTEVLFIRSAVPNIPNSGDTLLIGTQKARVKQVLSDAVSYTLVCEAA